MRDYSKTKDQLTKELTELRRKFSELDKLDSERRRVEEAEKASEARYLDLYENAPDMFVSVDAETSKIIRCNQTLANALGYTKEEVIGKPLSFIYHPDCEDVRKKAFRSFVETGEVKNVDLQLKRKDGSKIDVMLNVSAVRDEEGKVIYSRSVLRDITERKRALEALGKSEEALKDANEALEMRVEERTAELSCEIEERKLAEEALRESEATVRSILNATSDTFILVSADGVILAINQAGAERMGKSPEELQGTDVFSHFAPDLAEERKRRIDEVFRSGKPACFEDQRDTYVFNNSIFPIFGEKGVVDRVVIAAQEITERKQADKEFRKLSLAVEQSPVTVVITDTDGNIEYVNPKFTELTGYSYDEVIGQNPSILKSGEHTPEFYEDLWKTITSGNEWRGEFHDKKKNGELYWEEASISPIIDENAVITHFLAVKEDITEKKLAEEALRESEEKFRTLFEESKDAIYIGTPDGKILDCNPTSVELLGFSSMEEFMQLENIAQVYDDPKDREALITELKRKGFIKDIEVALRRKDGEKIFVIVTIDQVMDEGGNITAFRAIAHDITERKRAEEALQISETNLVKAQEVAHIGSWHLNLLENNLLWTDENYRIFGVPKGTPMTYEGFLEVVHPEDRDYVDKRWKAAIEGEPYDIEHRLLIGNEVKWVREKAELNFDDNGNATSGVGITQDITERKRAEVVKEELQAQLIQAQKMEAVGTLAGSVAHDFNNILTVVKTMTSMALSKNGDNLKLKEWLEPVRNASNRGINLVHQLLTFSQRKPVELESINLNDTIDDLLEMLRSLITEDISIEQDLKHGLWNIYADKGRVE